MASLGGCRLFASACLVAAAAPPSSVGRLAGPPDHLAPLCGDPDGCGAKRPPRKGKEPAKPLVEQGGAGFSYGPLPLLHPGTFPNDDVMASWMSGQWSWDGRNDLGVMAGMGANMVRLYGNDPRESAEQFLDEANGWGLKVVMGISDWPYLQAQEKCVGAGNDCYAALLEHFTAQLKTGGLLYGEGGAQNYHPALDTVIIINEPDLKIRSGDGKLHPQYMRAVLSAFDGILAAEKAMGLDITSKQSVKFTATWSYGTCSSCPNIMKLKEMGCCIDCSGADCDALGEAGRPPSEGGMRCPSPRMRDHGDDCPGLPMVVDFHAAVSDPSSVGYSFRTEGWLEAIKNRWVHSVNAFVPAKVFDMQFLSKYAALQSNNILTDLPPPVFLGEYGDPQAAKDVRALMDDLRAMKDLVKTEANPLFAFAFFEFQVAYWKPCSKEEESTWEKWMTRWWAEPRKAPALPASCSERNFGVFALGDIGVAKTSKIDGQEFLIPCLKPIYKDKPQAIAEALGGSAPETHLCEQGWQAKPARYCASARGPTDQIDISRDWVCSQFGQRGIDCVADLPAECEQGTQGETDWIFSTYYEKYHVDGLDDDHLCHFNGAGLLTPLPPRPECILTRGPQMPTVAPRPPPPPPLPPPSPPLPPPSPPPTPPAPQDDGLILVLIVCGVLLLMAGAVVAGSMARPGQVRELDASGVELS